MSFIYAFEIIEIVVPEPCILFWIPASTAVAAAGIPNWTKKFFGNGTATYFNGPAILVNNEPKNPPDWIILEIWVLGNFMSADILFSNAFLKLVFCFL